MSIGVVPIRGRVFIRFRTHRGSINLPITRQNGDKYVGEGGKRADIFALSLDLLFIFDRQEPDFSRFFEEFFTSLHPSLSIQRIVNSRCIIRSIFKPPQILSIESMSIIVSSSLSVISVISRRLDEEIQGRSKNIRVARLYICLEIGSITGSSISAELSIRLIVLLLVLLLVFFFVDT